MGCSPAALWPPATASQVDVPRQSYGATGAGRMSLAKPALFKRAPAPRGGIVPQANRPLATLSVCSSVSWPLVWLMWTGRVLATLFVCGRVCVAVVVLPWKNLELVWDERRHCHTIQPGCFTHRPEAREKLIDFPYFEGELWRLGQWFSQTCLPRALKTRAWSGGSP